MLKSLMTAIFGVFIMVNGACADSDSIYDLEAVSIDGAAIKLAEYRGKVLLVVNVASRCGYTPQYEGLQKLYDTYRERGLVVLGFPSNDFGGQEPGSEAEIKSFCSSKFGANFPLFSKVTVLGAAKHPVYGFLTQATGGREVNWNFEKFLVGKSGGVIGRFPSSVSPGSAELTDAIEKALQG